MEIKRQILYFDNNATTQVDKRVLDTMIPFFTNEFSNANSTHRFGLAAHEAVESARIQVSELIGADAHEIIFTSGSTESINFAIKGVAENYSYKGKHIVTVSTEHPSVLGACKNLETKGFEVSYIGVKSDGLIDLSELKDVLREDTILVCVMYVNNETGVIQPVKEIAELTHKVGALYMCDATQAVGKITMDVDTLGIDLTCMSGHKFYGPKGVGALYCRSGLKGVKLPAILHGGGQEKGLRGGTLNVPGIIALGIACEIAKHEMKQDSKRIFALRNELEKELLKIPGSYVNGNIASRLFNLSNICFRGFDANVMIGRMGYVAVSNGSACSSGTDKPSHVLTEMGLSNDDAFSSIRFSLGKFNNKNEVQNVVKLFMNYFIS